MRSYLTVWRSPSAPVLLLAGFAGRLPSSMVPLALLLMVQQSSGSFAMAGAVSATYGIATAAMAPVLGRLADRRSPRNVLLVQAVAYPFLLVLAAVAVLTDAPFGLVLAASAGVGVGTPLISGTVRALWSRADLRIRPTAFALDATATELVFVAGPAVVAALAFLASPVIALAVAGVFGVAGAAAVALSKPMRAWVVPVVAERRPLFGTVAAPGMPRVLLSGTGLMLGIGILEVSLPAFAEESGAPGMSGLLLAVWSLGSAVGGLWFGARVLSTTLPRQYRWGLLGVTIGMAPLAAVGNPLLLGLLLFLGGTAIAPTLTVQSSLVGAIAPASASTEAFTWLSTVSFGASAIGAAIGGAVIDGTFGVNGALVAATVAAALGVAVTLLPGRRPAPRRAVERDVVAV
ncbi:MFS transporter [Modestobacter sp. NPDC049651]|uniref:MFS transporter n=1 Tax=unclassified Modestobacter TaxID=2643866 RepID=UPI003409968A